MTRSNPAFSDCIHVCCIQGAITPELCVNDLEQPAFDNLPELLQLKQRLQSEGSFQSVFMTGSGSTIVCVGSDSAPQWLSEQQYSDLFVSPTRLIMRQPGGWYLPSSYSKQRVAGGGVPVAAAS
jgi:4-diphosphocytidyl-2-C-methyl-D-erythritol kinase